MANEISTVGASVLYCVETTAGTRPTTGYTVLPDVNQAPDFPLDVDVLDASNITDRITRYIPGRQDPGGQKTFTLNHTNAAIDAWATLVSAAETAYADGKQVWFQYRYPGAEDAFYWAGIPSALGNNGITQNEVNTIPAPVTANNIAGWAAISTADAA